MTPGDLSMPVFPLRAHVLLPGARAGTSPRTCRFRLCAGFCSPRGRLNVLVGLLRAAIARRLAVSRTLVVTLTLALIPSAAAAQPAGPPAGNAATPTTSAPSRKLDVKDRPP